MCDTKSRLHRRLALALMGCLVVPFLRADDTTPTPTPMDPPDPPGTTLYMGQLRLLFNQWDKDSSGYLDKQELAWAFRGPNAKPYDYDPKADKSKSTSGTSSDKQADPDKPADKPADPAPDKPTGKPDDSSSSSSGTKPTTTTKKPDYSQYPDYVFLTQLDTDGDGMISRAEFMSWARSYATQLKSQADLAQKLAQIQMQLANPKLSAADMKKLQAELKKVQDAQTRLANKTKSYETALSSQLGKKKS